MYIMSYLTLIDAWRGTDNAFDYDDELPTCIVVYFPQKDGLGPSFSYRMFW